MELNNNFERSFEVIAILKDSLSNCDKDYFDVLEYNSYLEGVMHGSLE